MSRRRPRSTRGEMRLPCRTTVKGEVHCWHRFVRLGITPACAGNRQGPDLDGQGATDHPRLRGEQSSARAYSTRRRGSPPPARGTGSEGQSRPVRVRITPACAGNRAPRVVAIRRTVDHPACAGNRRSATSVPASARDHPRLRGEQEYLRTAAKGAGGSPPPARGTGVDLVDAKSGLRITPACAGNRSGSTWASTSARDHPRLRGEQLFPHAGQVGHEGSPPPARGTDSWLAGAGLRRGITPACAGNRRSTPTPATRSMDHPRLRGEQRCRTTDCVTRSGSPPPARGTV